MRATDGEIVGHTATNSQNRLKECERDVMNERMLKCCESVYDQRERERERERERNGREKANENVKM